MDGAGNVPRRKFTRLADVNKERSIGTSRGEPAGELLYGEPAIGFGRQARLAPRLKSSSARVVKSASMTGLPATSTTNPSTVSL